MNNAVNNQLNSLEWFLRKEGYLVEKEKAPMQDTLYLFFNIKKRKGLFSSREETVSVGAVRFHKDLNGNYERCVLELPERHVERVATIINRNYSHGFGLEIKICNGN